MSDKTALMKPAKPLPPALRNAIALWADAKTRASSERRLDLLRDKTNAVGAFFSSVGKHPGKITPLDVKVWQAELEGKGLAPTTVYGRISQVSSFYEWALGDDALRREIHNNPVKLARPTAPRAYQNESAQALADDEAIALLSVVKAKADSGDVVGKRDYALLMFYLSTGMRRAEVIRLRWGDIKLNGGMTFKGKFKGGIYQEKEVSDPRVKNALLDYLKASGRLDSMASETPLWTSHDRAQHTPVGKCKSEKNPYKDKVERKPGKALTGHAFAKRLKKYAREAGIGDVHLHQTRHTFARMVSETTGSIIETQDALGHASEATTKAYVQRIAIKKDKHSTTVLDRAGAK